MFPLVPKQLVEGYMHPSGHAACGTKVSQIDYTYNEYYCLLIIDCSYEEIILYYSKLMGLLSRYLRSSVWLLYLTSKIRSVACSYKVGLPLAAASIENLPLVFVI